jgi:hypothetical protein
VAPASTHRMIAEGERPRHCAIWAIEIPSASPHRRAQATARRRSTTRSHLPEETRPTTPTRYSSSRCAPRTWLLAPVRTSSISGGGPPTDRSFPTERRYDGRPKQVSTRDSGRTYYSRLARLAVSSAAKRRERSVRGPCFSAEGGALLAGSSKRQPLPRTSSDSTSPTLTDCSIHDGAATSPVLARQLLSVRRGSGGRTDLGRRIPRRATTFRHRPRWPQKRRRRRESAGAPFGSRSAFCDTLVQCDGLRV